MGSRLLLRLVASLFFLAGGPLRPVISAALQSRYRRLRRADQSLPHSKRGPILSREQSPLRVRQLSPQQSSSPSGRSEQEACRPRARSLGSALHLPFHHLYLNDRLQNSGMRPGRQHRRRFRPQLQSFWLPIEPTIDASSDRLELASVRQLIQAVARPEPGGR